MNNARENSLTGGEIVSQAEPWLPPRELAPLLKQAGWERAAPRSTANLARAMRESGAPVILRDCVRLADALQWLRDNPKWRPYQR